MAPVIAPHFFISTMGQTHGTRMYVGAVLSFTPCLILSSGFTAEMTGFSYGGGKTCSPDGVP